MNSFTKYFFLLATVIIFSGAALAEANYIYHEQSTNTVGCNGIQYLTSTTPSWGSPVDIAFKIEYQFYTNQARIYYTTDGTEPQGAFGTGTGTTQVATATFLCSFSSGGIVDVCQGTIPAQPSSTTIRYKISAWHSGGGNEIFANSGSCCSPKTLSSQVPGWSFTTPLPVQLASFTATQTGNSVQLVWRTISEINNYGFFVEQRDGQSAVFTEIPQSFVAGRGTTNIPHEYSCTVIPARSSPVQFRLKQVDLDGTTHYTEPVGLNGLTSADESAPASFLLKQNYPNPFNPSTRIEFSVEKTGKASLDVFDMLGRKVTTLFDGIAEPGRLLSVQLDGSHLCNGIYVYRLTSGGKTALRRMILLK